jgi:hypothetical protein
MTNQDTCAFELFQFDRREWDIFKAKQMVKDRQAAPIDIEPFFRYLDSVKINKRRALRHEINLDVPIIVVTLKTKSGKTRQMPIDGWHRLYKARQLRVKTLPGHVLSEGDSWQVERENNATGKS